VRWNYSFPFSAKEKHGFISDKKEKKKELRQYGSGVEGEGVRKGRFPLRK
jgi:hypothetical protein